MTICLQIKWPYIAVKMDCEASGPNSNIGIIEKRAHGFGGIAGTLNLKECFYNQLQPEQWLHPLVPSPDGSTRGVGGTGFLGWMEYGGVSNVVHFLQAHFGGIFFCPVGGHIVVQNQGQNLKIPFPVIEVIRNECPWEKLKNAIEQLLRHHAIHQIVLRGGGNIPVPPWFMDFCIENGIEILETNPEQYDHDHPAGEAWVDDELNPLF